MPEWLKRLLGEKSQEQIGNEVAREILDQNKAAQAYAGKPQGDPLVDEHPGYYLAFGAAQPGGILTKAMAPYVYKNVVSGLQNGESALEAFAPGFKKIKTFGELGDLKKRMEFAEGINKPVDASKNVRQGKRPRVKATTEEPLTAVKTFTQDVVVPEHAEFKPYYIKSGEPVSLSAKQQAQKAADVKTNQIYLARYLQRLANERGINTTARHRKAMMKAIETNPAASAPPALGPGMVPYRTGYTRGVPVTIVDPQTHVPKTVYQGGEQKMFMGEPLVDWMEAADKQFGPHSTVLQLEKPLKAANNYWEASKGSQLGKWTAGSANIQMLSEGLENAAGLIKKTGGVLSAKSGIHIKKENRGKFTDYCGGKVTSECIARGKNSSNPAIRKRATFAANARKWKHENGGVIIPNWVYELIRNK